MWCQFIGKGGIFLEKGYDSKTFVQKSKQKYPRNKFFSYFNENRDNKNFNYKDFRNSYSINSSFKRCLFFGALFKKAKLKYCCFSGAVFTGITFTNCNFRGSYFIESVFDNCIFDNCIFQKCNFKNAKFKNTFIKNSSFKKSTNLSIEITKYDINKLKLIDDRVMTIFNRKYINTNVEALLNKVDISRLLLVFELNRLEKILDSLKANKKIQLVTFSHVLAKI